MNTDECVEFMGFAGCAYAEIRNLFANDPDKGKQRRDHWEQVFSDVELADAKAVVTAMLKGDADAPKFGWSEFPTVVRREARRIAGERRKATIVPDWKRDAGAVRKAFDPMMTLAYLWTVERMEETKQTAVCLQEIWPKGQDQPNIPAGWKPKREVRGMLKSASE